MAEGSHPDSVLMVGSIPFASVGEVLSRVCEAFPGRLHSIPDGEVGERRNWIMWQMSRLPPDSIRQEFGGLVLPAEKTTYTLDSVSPTLYEEVALSSYAKFVELRRQGVIPVGVRFQVCLPTALAVAVSFCKPECCADIEPLYEQRLFQSLKRIVEQIPHEDLVVQWDMSLELYLLELERGTLKKPTWDFTIEPHFKPIKAGLVDRLVRICQNTPADVPVGIHLCYGDHGHSHWNEPTDIGLLVQWTNSIAETLRPTHRFEYVQMPVPRERTDAEYFEPLRDLRLDKDTHLYLGLVHPNDEHGTLLRIDRARAVSSHPFGVSTECGLGRTPAEDIESIFEISKAVTKPKEFVDVKP